MDISQKTSTISLRVEAFKATQNKDLCLKYAEGHTNVLTSYGIKKISSTDLSWIEDENVYVFVIKSQSGDVVGGARIHINSSKNPLPIQSAIEPMDDSISGLINKGNGTRVGEVCALWNARSVSGNGLSFVLVQSCIAKSGIYLSNQLKIDTLYALCAPWTVKMFQDVGYHIYTDIGDHGTFPYPTNDLKATIMVVNDLDYLENANALDKQKIFELRKNPKKQELKVGAIYDINLNYDLFISTLEV